MGSTPPTSTGGGPAPIAGLAVGATGPGGGQRGNVVDALLLQRRAKHRASLKLEPLHGQDAFDTAIARYATLLLERAQLVADTTGEANVTKGSVERAAWEIVPAQGKRTRNAAAFNGVAGILCGGCLSAVIATLSAKPIDPVVIVVFGLLALILLVALTAATTRA